MWASKAIQEIQNDGRSNAQTGLTSADIKEIVRLGEGYSIVTEFTSFLVLENEGEYKRWKIKRRNALRENRDRNAQKKFNQELDRIRKQASAKVGPNKREKLAKNETEKNAFNNPQWHDSSNGRSSQDRMDRSPGLIRGGGAFDPITGGLVLLLTGSAFAARRKEN